ncbi:hypothetical protein CCHL11_10361 [Colletotrichum chlorophyti]|uniref:Uncharacterized protein n=1 Tax=Colletotrichum chlorophyti TaxID=708187 RepID=A0A1Q8RA17_9PEZI|nr:hypothetical protein CCHL11_10361 [Colletotrichum chlorophyti]
MALSPPFLPRPRAPRSLTAKEYQRLESLQLHLNEPEPVLICRPYGYALKPFGERVSRHLAEKHAVPKPQRRGLSAFVKSLGLVDPNDVALRPDGLPPHEVLIVARGYACRHCDYQTTSGDLISRHLSRTHSVKDSRKAESWQRDHVHCNVLLQSWSQNGPRGYWIVQPGTPKSPHYPKISINTADDLLRNASAAQQALLAAAHDAERSHLASRPSATSTITSQVDLAFQTNWMRRTGWDAMFDGACRDTLLKMSELPSPTRDGHTSENDMLPISPPGDEARLRHIVSAVDGAFDRSPSPTARTKRRLSWSAGPPPHMGTADR